MTTPSCDTLGPTALLYQALPPPVVGGVSKPPKPGGYSDSSADIAYALSLRGVPVITPVSSPKEDNDLDWCFPDTPEGIEEAIDKGAKTLWLNTVLFGAHPMWEIGRGLKYVGQPGERWDLLDDKYYTNTLFENANLPIPRSIKAPLEGSIGHQLFPADLRPPIMVKPVRGRGSFGVTLCESLEEIAAAASTLRETGSEIIVEEYLPGNEVTVTVMPPGRYLLDNEEREINRFWCLPPVARRGHMKGVLPYSGKVPVVLNSSAILEENDELETLQRACERATEIADTKAPVRIDCRADVHGRYKLFDFNLKPNITGPGRLGRDESESLVALAARAIGWSYSDLLMNILRNAW